MKRRNDNAISVLSTNSGEELRVVGRHLLHIHDQLKEDRVLKQQGPDGEIRQTAA